MTNTFLEGYCHGFIYYCMPNQSVMFKLDLHFETTLLMIVVNGPIEDVLYEINSSDKTYSLSTDIIQGQYMNISLKILSDAI